MGIDLRMFRNHDDSNKLVVDYLAVKIDVTRKDNNYYTILYRPINSNQIYDEFKWIVEKSDRFANMLVDGIFARDNNLYICIY